jgi:hypothetical protein
MIPARRRNLSQNLLQNLESTQDFKYYFIGMSGMVILPVQPMATFSSPDKDPERTRCWDRIIAGYIQKNLSLIIHQDTPGIPINGYTRFGGIHAWNHGKRA